MPVIPTFSQYAPEPNLSEAFLGRERLRQEAASDAARISLGYATLQQRAVESEMELAAKREALSRQALKQSQEVEIEKAYRDSQLGLAEQRLANDEKMTAMKIQDAAREFERGQNFYRRRQELTAQNPDLDAAEIDRRAMVDTSYGFPGFSQLVAGGSSGSPTQTATDRRSILDILQDQKQEAMIKFGPRSPEYQEKAKEIDDQIKQLLNQLQNPSARGSTLSPPSQWMVDPRTIPTGGTPRPSMFIGTPPPTQFDMSKISTNRPKLVSVKER